MRDVSFWLCQTFPWQLRTAIGLWLPLLVSLVCLWQLRHHARSKVLLAWLFGVAASGRALYDTAQIHTQQVGLTTHKGLQLHIEYAIWFSVLACGVAFLCAKRIDKRAIFAGVFLPLWLVDSLICLRMFPGDPSMLFVAVGGAGPLDALLIAPVFAVLMSLMFEWELANYERWNAWCARKARSLVGALAVALHLRRKLT